MISSGVPTPEDIEAVADLLGHRPRGEFTIAARRTDGTPMVIANAPLLFDDTPMPTRYWLVDRELRERVGRVESTGGVARAEAAVDADTLQAAHDRYAAERDALVAADYGGPRPYGGVGGTRKGVKCLHAHLAYLLAGGDDPVGRWTAEAIGGLPDVLATPS